MIELYCQHCGHRLKIPDQYAGQTGTCKNCGKKILVPAVGFEPDVPTAPTGNTKEIPYKWMGATAAVVALLAIGAYAILGRSPAAPTQPAIQAAAAPIEKPGASLRTVTFPSDRGVGLLFLRDKGVGAMWGRPQGPAQGTVTVPDGKEIGLWVTGSHSPDLAFLKALAPNDLDYLGIFHPSMTAAQLRNIEHLTGLKTLAVGRCDLTDSWLRSFKGLTNLDTLLLGSTKFTDAGLSTFAGLERLERLGLVGTKITHRGIRKLTSSSALEQIFLSTYAITPSMVEVLKGIPSLRRLKITANSAVNGESYGPASPETILLVKNLPQLEILTLDGKLHDDSLIEPLSQLLFLREIEFRNASTTAEGRNELRRRLPNCTISPADPSASNTAKNASPRIVAFPSDRAVGRVYLRREGVPASWWGAVQGPAQGPFTVPEGLEIGLAMSPKYPSDLAFLKAFAPNDLDYLLLFLPELTDDQFRNIEHLTGLTMLIAGYCDLTDAGLVSFQGLTNLEYLSFAGTKVTNAGLSTLVGLEGLKWLIISGTGVTHQGIRSLTSSPTLENVILSASQLTPSMGDALEELPSLRVLKLMTDIVINDKTYSLSDGPASPETILLIRNLSQLEILVLAGPLHDDSLIQPLSQLRSLKEIRFLNTSTTVGGRNELRRRLPNCTILPAD